MVKAPYSTTPIGGVDGYPKGTQILDPPPRRRKLAVESRWDPERVTDRVSGRVTGRGISQALFPAHRFAHFEAHPQEQNFLFRP